MTEILRSIVALIVFVILVALGANAIYQILYNPTISEIGMPHHDSIPN